MDDLNSSIIGNPKLWSRPEDVVRREHEMREGVSAYRRQRREEEDRRKGLARSILTPEPAKAFAERYALHVDATTGEPFLVADPDGYVRFGS